MDASKNLWIGTGVAPSILQHMKVCMYIDLKTYYFEIEIYSTRLCFIFDSTLKISGNSATVSYLLSLGLNKQLEDKFGETPCDVAKMRIGEKEERAEEYRDVVRMLSNV